MNIQKSDINFAACDKLSPAMNNLVRLERQEEVAIIVIDNPPVNALGQDVYDGMMSVLDAIQADATFKSIVILAAGRTFVAGADIKLLEAAARGEAIRLYLRPLLMRIEDSPIPVLVGLHGTALGGGMELAMAGHYRAAVADAKMGQPEVNLGIIPGAEGTQRLPRLVGVAAAVEICVSGRPITAQDALKLGLIDRIVEGDLRAGTIAFAREVQGRSSYVKTRDRRDKLGTPESNAPGIEAGRQLAAKVRRNMTAPAMVIEAIQAAATLDWEQGLDKERELADICLKSPQAVALMHAFFAERGVAKIPDITKDIQPIEIKKAAIIGAGTMGGGIAMALVNAGIPVLLKDTEQAALDRGMAAIRKNYDASVKKGRFTPEVVEQRMAMIHPQTGYEGFQDVNLVLEAVFENMALKKQIFSEIDKVAGPNCVLASNTSTLDIDEIAASTSRPEKVIGLHFFAPANVMRLVEIVRGKKTSKEIVATAQAVAKKLGKVGVVVGNCWGFVGNRMMLPYMREAQFLVEEGATPSQVDKALYDFGMAMGIFAVDDMGGIDILWRVRQENKHREKPGVRKPLMTDKLYEMGRLGQKTGAGWYRYDENRKANPDPEVEALIKQTGQAAGIAQRTISDEEIIERCLYVMINEAAKILQEGYALRAADIDTIYLSGYGFPSYRGGPMWYADTVGLKKIYDRIQAFHREHGELWEPAPLLKQLAEQGRTFAQWDEQPR
jgi:3-hydroxyacyl-CoA dehydrogenase